MVGSCVLRRPLLSMWHLAILGWLTSVARKIPDVSITYYHGGENM